MSHIAVIGYGAYPYLIGLVINDHVHASKKTVGYGGIETLLSTVTNFSIGGTLSRLGHRLLRSLHSQYRQLSERLAASSLYSFSLPHYGGIQAVMRGRFIISTQRYDHLCRVI